MAKNHPTPPTPPTPPAARTARTPTSRRGTIYISVLSVSILVLVIGLGAVAVGRVNARTAAIASDFAEARVCARSGLELGMLAVYNDPYWRRNLANGKWITSMPIGSGGGTVTVEAMDPTDADVTTGENHPVVLSATGVKGAAKYVLSMRMEVGAPTGSCLEASLCSADNLTISGTKLNSDQTIRSNAKVSAVSGAIVNAAVEGTVDVIGGTYTGTVAITGKASTLPDPATVFDYYTTNGTPIAYTKLQPSDTGELIANGHFERRTAGWYAVNGCTLQRNTTAPMIKSGSGSLLVTNRDSNADSAATNLDVSRLVSGHAYSLVCPVYSTGAANMRVVITVTTDQGTFPFTTGAVAVAANTWTDLKVDFPAVSWTGTLSQVTLSVDSNAATRDFYIDAVSFKDMTVASTIYVMEEELLSPTVNPYGPTNSKGIYLINCAGKDVVITNSRIVGTLVLVTPGPNSKIRGSVCMEPAAANFPAFMSDAAVSINLSATPLSEAGADVNFNPSGSAYPYEAGTGSNTNATKTDSYPSAITGLVYAKKDLVLNGDTTINGVVVGNLTVQVLGSTLTLKYNNYYLNNPPPGFTAGTIQMKPVPGTWQRISN